MNNISRFKIFVDCLVNVTRRTLQNVNAVLQEWLCMDTCYGSGAGSGWWMSGAGGRGPVALAIIRVNTK